MLTLITCIVLNLLGLSGFLLKFSLDGIAHSLSFIYNEPLVIKIQFRHNSKASFLLFPDMDELEELVRGYEQFGQKDGPVVCMFVFCFVFQFPFLS